MLKVIIIFLIILTGLVVGPLLAGHQGVAFFQLAGYQIKMSVTTFIALDLLFILCLFLSHFLLNKLVGDNNVFMRFFNFIFNTNIEKKIAIGQLFFIEGNYKKAEKLLSRSAARSNNQTLIYLQATQAAMANHDFQSAKALLDKAALACTTKEKLAFQLVKTRLLFKNNELAQAKREIEKLLATHPKHPEILRLAYAIYHAQHNYQQLIAMMSSLYKNNVFPKHQLQQDEQRSYLSLIQQLAKQPDEKALKNWWKKQPKIVKQNPVYLKEAAKQFNLLGDYSEADSIRTLLTKQAAN